MGRFYRPNATPALTTTSTSLKMTSIGKNLLLDLQRKLYIIKVRWQVKKGR